MLARLWNYVVLMTVMVTGMNGTLMPSFAQAKEQTPTFTSTASSTWRWNGTRRSWAQKA